MTRIKWIFSVFLAILGLSLLSVLFQFLAGKYLGSIGLYIPIILIIVLSIPIFLIISALRDDVTQKVKDTPKAKDVPKPVDPPKPAETKKDDKKKDDSKKSDKNEVSFWNSNALKYFLTLLIILSVGYLWGNDVSLLIKESGVIIGKNIPIFVENIKLINKERYKKGVMTRWSRDDKTNQPLPPKTIPITVRRWDNQEIFIEFEVNKKRIGNLKWDRKDTTGTWYDPIGLSGTWFIRLEKSINGEYGGWIKSDKHEEKHPLIIRID